MSDTTAVLVIDDDELLRDIASGFLSEAGYRVFVAASGEEGLRLFVQNSGEIGLVLSDLGLPGMSGVDLLKKVLELSPTTQAVAMSGFGGEQMIKQVEKMSGVTFLPKPFSRSELLTHIKSRIEPSS